MQKILQHEFPLVPFSFADYGTILLCGLESRLRAAIERQGLLIRPDIDFQANMIMIFVSVSLTGEHFYLETEAIIREIFSYFSPKDMDIHSYTVTEIHHETGNQTIITIHSIEP